MSEKKFQKLETEVRQLIKVSQQLKEVNEDLSTKNSTLRKENRDLEESLDKTKKGISQIIKRYKD
jgi:chaperonin cofactor prefoldin